MPPKVEVHPDEHPYGDIHRPAAPYSLYHMDPLFREGTLIDREGLPRRWEELFGKSVALYFHDSKNNHCNNLFPRLLLDYRTLNENSDRQKMEIVYVPLDETEEEYLLMRERTPWLSLRYDAGLIREFVVHFLVQKFNVTTPPYGYGALTDVPGLIVIDRTGAMLKNLAVDEIGYHRSWKALGKWDLSLKF